MHNSERVPTGSMGFGISHVAFIRFLGSDWLQIACFQDLMVHEGSGTTMNESRSP